MSLYRLQASSHLFDSAKYLSALMFFLVHFFSFKKFTMRTIWETKKIVTFFISHVLLKYWLKPLWRSEGLEILELALILQKGWYQAMIHSISFSCEWDTFVTLHSWSLNYSRGRWYKRQWREIEPLISRNPNCWV